ncbi:MAG: RagB/SusD family nutrient uptake outer membrane protein [Gemmatimonadetes bacterium]|nr:RagB/SusD family nutrient uptake outer membrane protein [Gemmatimonadota bacterium]
MNRALTAAIPGLLLLAACDGTLLEEEVYSQLASNNFFRTEQDAVALVNAAYSLEQIYVERHYLIGELPADILIVRSGGLQRLAQPLEDFTWDATHIYFNSDWDLEYQTIARANLAIERIPAIDFNEDRKRQLVAEARFIRAESYIELYTLFGPAPLITSSEVDPRAQPARATEAEMQRFIESELREVAAVLPKVAAQYPRATRGAALGLLARFHLNNKKWQPAAEVTREIMDLGIYDLFAGQRRGDLFAIENERNSEFIYVRPFVTNLKGNNYLAHAAPPNYRFKAPPKTNFAAQYKLLTAFTSTFRPEDQRKDVILTEYTDVRGRVVKLGKDDWRSFKYQEDLAATGSGNGNDIPIVRYADVLLMRAEALNELQGPNQESIGLINQVRNKAGVPPVTLAALSTRQALRDHLLEERRWEFFTEGLRRQDLIRHGKYIELAQKRGKNAQAHHVWYPLPQSEIDKNPNLQQNPGY